MDELKNRILLYSRDVEMLNCNDYHILTSTTVKTVFSIRTPEREKPPHFFYSCFHFTEFRRIRIYYLNLFLIRLTNYYID